MLRGALAIALTALIASACSSSRRVMDRESLVAAYGLQERVKEASEDSLLVAVRDSVTETTTISVVLRAPPGQEGVEDTVRVVQVTDRNRVRDHAVFRHDRERLDVRNDTALVVCRDSVRTEEAGLKEVSPGRARASPRDVVLRCILVFLFLVILSIHFKVERRLDNGESNRYEQESER